MTNAELIVELQNQGFGAGLTAGQWTQVVTDAVRLYGYHRPRTVLGTITTAVDVEEYDLPTGGRVCLDVQSFSAIEDLWAEITGTAMGLIGVPTGDVIFDFDQPSQVDIYRQKISHYERQFGSRWEQEYPGGKVRLLPRPTEAQTLAVLYTRSHDDASTVPAGDVHLLLKAGRAVAFGVLATAGAVTVVTSGGRLTLGPYTRDLGGIGAITAHMFKQAQDAEKDFLDSAQVMGGAQRY